MRIILFFDLPVVTSSNRREYRKFHKYLVRNGFIMMQESVYSKLVQNSTAVDAVILGIKKNKPSTGLVQTITVTEAQFSRMLFIVGDKHSDVLDSTEKVVVI